ncbi:MAG: putative AlkP superfamily phosphohydrolase/phosphomutase [Candidatus Binatia bacterium]
MLLVVAWDGADLNLVEPWMRAGELPNLAAVAERGAVHSLASTIPPVTFPAWTSFATACDPSWHGITDFTVRDVSSGRLRFVNASWRAQPTIFSRMQAAGLRTGVLAFPATWPPEKLSAQICGFDTPLGSVGSAASEPPELASQLIERFGALPTGGPDQTRIGPGWHHRALESLLASIELRTRAALFLQADKELDVLAVHFMESDTAAHHFWQFHDHGSPRFKTEGPEQGLLQVYRALDRSLGQLLEGVGTDANVMVVSDHGSRGASDQVVFWNRWLSDHGYLAWNPGAGLRGRLGAAVRRFGIKLVPSWVQRQIWRHAGAAVDALESEHRFGGIDWSQTRVFSEELNYAPALWLNLRGRDPQGTVSDNDVEKLVADLQRDLAAFVHPRTGRPIVARLRRREEIYSGPFLERLPDLILELEPIDGYVPACGSSRGGAERATIRSMTSDEASGAKGTFMSGAHDACGVCVLAGPGSVPSATDSLSIEEAGATALAMAGVGWPGAPFARPIASVAAVAAGDTRSSTATAPQASAPDPQPYDEAGEREVRERLRALGYLR